MGETLSYRRPLHPIHAVLVSSALPLFLGALLSDWAYSSTYEIQWTNFASWLIVGALLFVGLALVWAVIDSLRADTGRDGHRWLHVALLAACLIAGFFNSLVHAKDAWAAMPAGLILSLLCVLLILAALWTGFSSRQAGGAR